VVKQEKGGRRAKGLVIIPHPKEVPTAYEKSIASLFGLQEWIIYRFEMNKHRIDVMPADQRRRPAAPTVMP